jgi:hypothetical protein
MPTHYGSVAEHAKLNGRDLEPWRGLLTVARWLDSQNALADTSIPNGTHGTNGSNGTESLFERLLNIVHHYYEDEKPNLDSGNLTEAVVRGLISHAISAVNSVSAINFLHSPLSFSVKDILQAAKKEAEESEMDIDIEAITSRRVGRALSALRLKQNPRPGGKGSRQWEMTIKELCRLARRYHIPTQDLDEILKEQEDTAANGTHGTAGTNGTHEAPSDTSETSDDEHTASGPNGTHCSEEADPFYRDSRADDDQEYDVHFEGGES